MDNNLKPREQGTFSIIRFYSKIGRASKVMATGYTWKQAEAHCNDPKTRKEGEWFDGFHQTN